MDIFRKIAERKIVEAIEKGELQNLCNSGKPIRLEDDRFISEELRIGHRVLKNAGCVPPELELRKEIISLRSLINTIDDDKERLQKIRKLNFSMLKLAELRKKPLNIEDFPEYEDRFSEKLL